MQTKLTFTPQSEIERQILVVDDEEIITETVARMLELSGFECRTAHRAEEGLKALSEQPAGLVISDINMPVHNGLWLLGRLREEHPDTAVIMLTGFAEVDTAVECLRTGASDFLTKPLHVQHLFTAVQRALERRRMLLENRAYQRDLEVLVQEKTHELQEAYQQVSQTYQMTLEALCSALDAREEETANHSQRVTSLTLELAATVAAASGEREHFARGALLHDIGKIGVPDHILLKPGKLTDEEWVVMRRHPEIGGRILQGIPFLRPAAEIVISHHERFDGSGYPNGLSSDAIPIGARIFSVADALDAITSDRPYRKTAGIDVALAEVNRWAGSQFDPLVVAAANQIGEHGLSKILAINPPAVGL